MTDRSPKRIVALTEETTEVLCHLGLEDRLVGISGFTVRPRGISRRKPKISTFTSADYEAILTLEPDLVVGFSDLQADLARELVRRGVPVLVTNQRSVSEILGAITMLGAIVGRAEEAARYADGLEARLEARTAAVRGRSPRPRVYFEEWPDPIITGIRWVEELVERAGGDPLFPEHRTCGLAKDRIVTADAVRARTPDLVLASWCGKKVDRTAFARRPGWDALPAARPEYVVPLRSADILQPGPAALTDGFDAIASAIDAWHARTTTSAS